MEELTVQKVYDVLKERVSIVEHILSGKSNNFKLTSTKLRKSFNDIKEELQKYIDDIDNGVYGDKADPVNDVLYDLYWNELCPNNR